MKTLKQLREEYDAKTLETPETMMLEDVDAKPKTISRASPVPSSKEMPVMLIFRRVQYRVFPKGQVVALYYSSMVNKYLSIPFGPDGNLNLSEATFEDVDIIKETKSVCTKDTRESYKNKVKELREFAVPVAMLAGAARAAPYLARAASIAGKARAAASTAINVAGKIGKMFSGSSNNESKSASSGPSNPYLGQNKAQSSNVAGKSSWNKIKSNTNSVYQSKMKQADLAQAKKAGTIGENRIRDIRKMVREGVESKELNINGRSITLNTSMAKRILETYDSLNPKNRKIVENMMNSDLESFKKLLNFSIKQ